MLFTFTSILLWIVYNKIGSSEKIGACVKHETLGTTPPWWG